MVETATEPFPSPESSISWDRYFTSRVIDLERPESWKFNLQSSFHSKLQDAHRSLKFIETPLYPSETIRSVHYFVGFNIANVDPWIESKLKSRAKARKALKFRLASIENDEVLDQTDDKLEMKLLGRSESSKADTHETLPDQDTDVNSLFGGDSDNNSLFGEPNHIRYIALSYCWHNQFWQIADNLRSPAFVPGSQCPTSPAMWNALLSMQTDSTRHIWFDQGCIDQSDENEKADAIACMDIIYASAEITIVILEDVVLSSQDRIVLFEYQKLSMATEGKTWCEWSIPPHLIQDLATICSKLEKARWMRRAWCFHEFQTSSSRIYMVSVSKDEQPSGGLQEDTVEILTFDERLYFLLHWAKVHAQNTRVSDIGKPFNAAQTLDLLFKHQNFSMTQVWKSGFVTRGRPEANSMTDILAGVLSFHSGSQEDKLSIYLNIIKSEISLVPGVKLNAAEIAYIGNMVALSRGDPSPLTNSGTVNLWRSLPVENHTYAQLGWTVRPHRDGVYRRFAGLHFLLEHQGRGIQVVPNGIRIRVIFLAKSTDLVASNTVLQDTVYEIFHKYYVKKRADMSEADYVAEPDRLITFLEKEQSHIPTLLWMHLVDVIIIMIELGPSWVVFTLKQVFPDHLIEIRQEILKQLRINIDESNGQWKEESSWDGNQWNALIHIAERIILTSCGPFDKYLSNTHRENWKFQKCVQNTDSTASLNKGICTSAPKYPWADMIFAPVAVEGEELFMVYPLAVKDLNVIGGNRNRIWILKASEQVNEGGEDIYVLQGKSEWVGDQATVVPTTPELEVMIDPIIVSAC